MSIAPLYPLPVEINLEILQHLVKPSELYYVALVCKGFLELTRNGPELWKRLAELRWGAQKLEHRISFDWMKYYRERLSMERKVEWEEVSGTGENIPLPRQSHGATRFDDKLLIFGGHQIHGDTFERRNDAWLYDPTTNQYEQLTLGGQPKPISRHKCLTFGEKVYSFGGILQDKTKVSSVYCIDVKNREFTEIQPYGQAPEPRCDPVVVSYKQNIVVFGGSVGDFVFPSDIHLFDTNTHTWSQPQIIGKGPSPRIGCTGAVIGDKLYIYGGGDWCRNARKYEKLFMEIWSLDLKTFKWTLEPATGDIPPMSDFLNAFTIGNHIVIEGGWYCHPYAYDTISHQWKKLTTSSILNNNDSTCTVIGDQIFYYGGYFNHYMHHLVKMDMSHLAFLRA